MSLFDVIECFQGLCAPIFGSNEKKRRAQAVVREKVQLTRKNGS